MDFGSRSPTHTILVLFMFIGFVGQVAVYFHRTAQNDKKIDRQEERFFHGCPIGVEQTQPESY